MGKFSVGKRFTDADGDLCEVIKKTSKGWREVRILGGKSDGITLEYPKCSLTPVADNDNGSVSASAEIGASDYVWVPKVGDRVRVKAGHPYYLENDEMGVEAIGVVTSTDNDAKGYRAKYGVTPDGSSNEVTLSIDEIEPVVAPATTAPKVCLSLFDPVPVAPQPAPFTIEAGKFYRTRDGRKVGPMRTWAVDVNHPWEQKNGDSAKPYVGLYNDAGKSTGGSKYDIVAEWVEPTPEPVAVAEATATPFKKGDRVKPTEEKRDWVTSHWRENWADRVGKSADGEFYVVRLLGGDVKISSVPNGDGPYWSSESFIPAEPAAPPAKFKVGDRVGISADDANPGTVTGYVNEEVGVRWDKHESFYRDTYGEHEITILPPTIRPGATVTFVGTGRVSAINENGHVQVTFPDLLPGQNSFALPAKYVALAN